MPDHARAGVIEAEWAVPVVREVQSILLTQRDRWAANVAEDQALEPLWEAFAVVLTRERAAQIVGAHPEVLDLPGPGAVGPTLADVVADVLREAVEDSLIAWMDQEAGVDA